MTMMTPILDYFNQNTNKYTTLIILTDGYIENDPPKPVAGRKVLWCISSNGVVNENWPGYKIQIKR